MKKLLTLAVVLASLSALATGPATVAFYMVGFDQTPVTTIVSIKGLTNPSGYGTNLVVMPSKDYKPTNGVVYAKLLTGNYTATIGPYQLNFPVPDATNLFNILDLSTNTVLLYMPTNKIILASGVSAFDTNQFLMINNNIALLQGGLAQSVTSAKVPWRGWESWMLYLTTIAETNVTYIMDGFVTNGLRDAGWDMICIDDGWSAWDANGRVTNNTKFPHGIKWLADYAHTNGLRLGLYMFPYLTNTPGYFPASGQNFVDDVLRQATNGVDFIFWESYADEADFLSMKAVNALQTYFPKIITQSSRHWPRVYDPAVLNSIFPVFTYGDPDMNTTNLYAKIVTIGQFFSTVRPGHFLSLGSTPVGTDPPMGEFTLSYQSLQGTIAAPIYKLYTEEQHWYGQYESTNKSFSSICQDALVASPQILVVTNNQGNTNSIGVARRMMDDSYAVWHFSINNGWTTNSLYLQQMLGLPKVCSVRSIWDDCFVGYVTNYLTEGVTNGSARFRRIYPGLVTDIVPGTNLLENMWWNKDFSSNGCFVPSSIWVELPQRRTDAAGRAIVIGGVTYSHGITMRANGCLNYFLGGQADVFHAVIGPQIDAGADQTNTVRLVGDGVTLWQSGFLTTGIATNIMIDLAGVHNFQIITTNAFNVNWAAQFGDAMFIKATPTYAPSASFGSFAITSTNYVVSSFVPIAGQVKFVPSNNWIFAVTQQATNPVVKLTP
jgi:hypothetical protein